ncbi:hypothetical protein [Streptomyces sp. WAC01280]|uniref:hypothetical protein n=1 Tax=Streptomyces sp. WAC01280 TaxID=2487424 RepID=UPI000F771F49|nr:hypothetical protein [Streptomyces sp. WAC01280]RSS53165.1 hypothetical protein EF909_27040 [Streptomyces sp. WAC01280]
MKAQLEHRSKQVIGVAGGLTAFFIAVVSGAAAAEIYAQSNTLLRAVVFTLVAFAGFSLGMAYIRYEEAHTKITKAIDEGVSGDTPSEPRDWPGAADCWWHLALLFTTLAPVSFLFAVWWAAF